MELWVVPVEPGMLTGVLPDFVPFAAIILGGLVAACCVALRRELRMLGNHRRLLPPGSEFMGFGSSRHV